MNKFKAWLNKGEGGEFYEPYVTNGDILICIGILVAVSSIILLGMYVESLIVK